MGTASGDPMRRIYPPVEPATEEHWYRANARSRAIPGPGETMGGQDSRVHDDHTNRESAVDREPDIR